MILSPKALAMSLAWASVGASLAHAFAAQAWMFYQENLAASAKNTTVSWSDASAWTFANMRAGIYGNRLGVLDSGTNRMLSLSR